MDEIPSFGNTSPYETKFQLYLHLDSHAVHYMKAICDDIFGYKSFKSEIIWQRKLTCNSVGEARAWPTSHDTILFYVKRGKGKHIFNQQFFDDSDDLPDSIRKGIYKRLITTAGASRFVTLEAISDSPSLKYVWKGFEPPKEDGNGIGREWKRIQCRKHLPSRQQIKESPTKALSQRSKGTTSIQYLD